jgi:hypothetical protein
VNVTDNFICVCKASGGNPPADVTLYKGNKQIGQSKKGEQTLRLINVDRNDAGTYRCEAKSHDSAVNETEIELIVNCKQLKWSTMYFECTHSNQLNQMK